MGGPVTYGQVPFASTVTVGDSSGGGGGDGGLSLPPAISFAQPDSPPASGGQRFHLLSGYISNPDVYKNPDAAKDGSKLNNPGTPPENLNVVDNEVVQCKPANGGGQASTLVAFLKKCLDQAASGCWRETGQRGAPSNPNIIGMWKNIGITWYNSDQVPWCAGFTNFALKSSGFKFLKEANAFAMGKRCAQYEGTIISTSQMAPGDLVIWNSGHINICYTSANGKFTFVGGNQAPGSAATPPVRDPSNDGDVSISYARGWVPSLGGIQTVIRINC